MKSYLTESKMGVREIGIGETGEGKIGIGEMRTSFQDFFE